MEIDKYISNKRKFYDNLLEYLVSDSDCQGSLHNDLVNLRKDKNLEEIKSFINLLLQIAQNHQRTPTMIKKIENILLFFKKEIRVMSNIESHKLILLFILQNNFITIDQQICESLSSNPYYRRFFSLEIKSFYEGKNC